MIAVGEAVQRHLRREQPVGDVAEDDLDHVGVGSMHPVGVDRQGGDEGDRIGAH